MAEIWKAVTGYEGRYEVSDAGRVRSLPRMTTDKNGRSWPIAARVLRPGVSKSKSNRGYHLVALCKDGVVDNFYVHRLVAGAFIEGREHRTQVNHIDGNNFNNAVSNLEFCTPSENQLHAHASGLKANTRRGSRCGTAKLVEEDIKHIRLLLTDGFLNKDIAYGFGVDSSIVSNIRHGKIWKHVT